MNQITEDTEKKPFFVDTNAREFRLNPFPFYARMRREAPVYKFPGQDTYALTKYDDVVHVLTDPESFSSNLVGDILQKYLPKKPMPKVMILLDPPAHGEFRKKLNKAFAPGFLKSMEVRIREIAFLLAEELAADSQSDFAESFGRPLPVIVIGDLLGVPLKDKEKLLEWAESAVKGSIPPPGETVGISDLPRILWSLIQSGPSLFSFGRKVGFRTALELARNAGIPALLGLWDTLRSAKSIRDRRPTLFNLQNKHFAKSQKSTLEFMSYLHQIVLERRKNPGDLVIDTMIGMMDRKEITYSELLINCIFMLVAGHETTVQLLCQGAKVLAERPDVFQDLKKDPELIKNFVEETLRWKTPLHWVIRRAAKDTEISGIKIPENSRLVCYIGAANRDSDHFENPDEFDLYRANSKKNLSFGKGHHFCLGAPLARLEAEIAFEILSKKLHSIHLDPVKDPIPVDPSFDGGIRGFRSLPVLVQAETEYKKEHLLPIG